MNQFTYLPTVVGETTVYTSPQYPGVSVTVDRKNRVTITYQVGDGTQNIFDHNNIGNYQSADYRLEQLFQRGYNAMQGQE